MKIYVFMHKQLSFTIDTLLLSYDLTSHYTRVHTQACTQRVRERREQANFSN